MKMKSLLFLIGASALLFLSGCGGYVPADELENDITGLDAQIEILTHDMAKYSSGVIFELMQVRMEILKNTRTMLEQKKSGSNRLIQIHYTVNGTPYVPPEDAAGELEKIERAMTAAQDRAGKARLEADQYEGGLVRVMVEMKTATEENTVALLNQKRMSLAYGFPLYTIAEPAAFESAAAVRKPMEGSTIENL